MYMFICHVIFFWKLFSIFWGYFSNFWQPPWNFTPGGFQRQLHPQSPQYNSQIMGEMKFLDVVLWYLYFTLYAEFGILDTEYSSVTSQTFLRICDLYYHCQKVFEKMWIMVKIWQKLNKSRLRYEPLSVKFSPCIFCYFCMQFMKVWTHTKIGENLGIIFFI